MSASVLRVLVNGISLIVLSVITCYEQQSPQQPQTARPSGASQVTVSCASKAGERTQCAADTTAGVVLVRSTGTAACLLGKTWGYDQTSIWVSDGWSADFRDLAGASLFRCKIAPGEVGCN